MNVNNKKIIRDDEKNQIKVTPAGDTLQLHFDYDETIVNVVRTLPNRRYHPEERFWTIPARAGADKLLQKHLGNYAKLVFIKTSPEQEQLVHRYVEHLERKRYSIHTIKNYRQHLQSYFSFIGPSGVINHDSLLTYLNYLVSKRKVSPSFQQMAVNAIRYLVVNILKDRMPKSAVRPKKSKPLPVVLSTQEIKDIISQIKNIKHRTAVTLIYSAGLRISEAINLRLNDIDYDRGIIIIRQAKGKKDRQVPLSNTLKVLIPKYFNEYTPGFYFLEGQKGGKYSAKSIQVFFKKACCKANLKSPLPYTL